MKTVAVNPGLEGVVVPFENTWVRVFPVSPTNLKLWVVEMDQNAETVGKVIGIESRRKQSRLRRRARRARIRASTRVRSTVRKGARNFVKSSLVEVERLRMRDDKEIRGTRQASRNDSRRMVQIRRGF